VTDPIATGPKPTTNALPPDPAAFDAPRNAHARARGLAAPYIAGGNDPDPAVGRREERYYGRLLVAMVLFLIFGGFVVGAAIALASAGA
jgi:hypothetical protein